jgi:hypothetical protein
VKVDLELLIEAFEDASAGLNYYVDLETGDVMLVSDTLGFIEAGQQRFEMELTPGRYLAVPEKQSIDFDDDLEAFLERLDDDELARTLEHALDALNPSKSIDAILSQHEEIAADWKRFQRVRVRERAMDWLNEHKLDVVSCS